MVTNKLVSIVVRLVVLVLIFVVSCYCERRVKILKKDASNFVTHSSNITLPLALALSQALLNPPDCMQPSIRVASSPTIIITTWNTSVHSTAFIPP